MIFYLNKFVNKQPYKKSHTIKLFGEIFVSNNKGKLKIEVNGKIRELNQYYFDDDIDHTII